MRLAPPRPAPRAAGRAALLAAGLAAALACASAPPAPPPPPVVEPDRAPPALAPAVARGDAAIKALRERLTRRLMEELHDPPGAVSVCQAEAPAIAAEVRSELGVEVGRTSVRLRNQENAPRPWMRPHLEASAGKKASEVKATVIDLGDRVGVLRPIPVGSACLRCHGPVEGISPMVRDRLQRGYPLDRAVGFAEGDLRGFFWAEAPKGAP